MEQMLHIVKNITVFILLFSVISNLFSKSKYQKYFDFIEGLMIIILVMTPLFAWFTSDRFLDECLKKNISSMEEESFREELEMIGGQRDQMLRELPQEGGGVREDE